MKTLTTVDEIAELFNSETEEIDKKYCSANHDPEEIHQKVKSVMDATCLMLKNTEDDLRLQPEVLKNERLRFQQQTNTIILKSYFATRARTWPQGYQGDFKTLETIYRGTSLSYGVGYYIDHYSFNTPLSGAIKNRITILKNLLSNELSVRNRPRILNIACGSCRELIEITPEIRNSKARILCIDNDSDALDFAYNRLSFTPVPSNVTFRRYNALRMIDCDSIAKEFGNQDIIYSIGFFDYLPDSFLIDFLRSLYALLRENGRLIVAFKDADYYDSILYHWIVDWTGFKQRNNADFLRIFREAEIPAVNISSMKDDTNIVTFFLLRKD